MKKILFPTEFSAHAAKVLQYAAELALQFDAQLSVMHSFYNPKFRLKNEEEKKRVFLEVLSSLKEFIGENLDEQYTDINIEYIVEFGLPTNAIINVAIDEEIDFIVMGQTGKNAGNGYSFGNTAIEVLSKADCDVLLVPAQATFKGIDQMAFATNFEFKDLGAINRLLDWSYELLTPLHVLHIAEQADSLLEMQHNLDILEATYAGESYLRFHLFDGEFPKQIQEKAEALNADIIALTANNSTAVFPFMKQDAIKRIALASAIPLLVMKEGISLKANFDSEYLLESMV